MHFSTLFGAVGLAGLASSAPTKVAERIVSRQAPGAQNVVYWGQNGGGTIENNDLSTYCTSTSGVDVIVLAFLYQYGNGQNIPGGTIGQSCYISSSSGEGQDCDNVANSIPICQAAGIKVILSIGGAAGSYSLQSQSEAETIGQYLWDSYGNSGNTAVQRPFGNNFVNGWDFDIEDNPSGSSQYYQYLISTLRSNFSKDPKHTYYITGAPQCPIPEPNMGQIISTSQFDYLWVQFYNNNNYTYPCALGINGDAAFNYQDWVSFIGQGPSKNAKLFIGVPASPLGANGSPSGSVYYATPSQLAGVVAEVKSDSHFGGIMMWSAGFSDSNVNSGCTYAQEAKNILLTGTPCSGGPPATTHTQPAGGSGPSSTSSASKPTSTASGTVPQWGQVSFSSPRFFLSLSCFSPLVPNPPIFPTPFMPPRQISLLHSG